MDTLTTSSNQTQLATHLSQELYTRYSLLVSSIWIADFLSTIRNPPPPLPALVSTANFRLLNSDFTQSLSRSASSTSGGREQALLPSNIADVNVKQSQLQTDVPVQVLDILDVGSSKWAQIEAIERVERGEEVRGREIVRNVPIMNEEDGLGSASAGGNAVAAGQSLSKKSAGPHRLLLQDAAGTRVWGFELVSVSKVCITMAAEDGGLQIGAKMLLKKDVVVRRGLVMLEPGGVSVMGGKVEEWDKKWRIGRKQRLKDDLTRENEQEEQGT